MRDILDRLTEASICTKEELCEDNGGPADSAPIIIGMASGLPFMLSDTNDGHPVDNLGMILNAIAEGLDEKNKTMKWDWIAFVVEGYANKNPDMNVVESHEYGSYERDFKNNPASQVSEGIIISVFDWDGNSYCRSLLYHYGDDGMPVWDEPINTDEAMQGRIPDIFEGFRVYCHYEGDIKALIADKI